MLVKGKQNMFVRWNNPQTASRYIQDRFVRPMWRMMHEKEVSVVNDAISRSKAKTILDLATGPARVAKDLVGFESGWAVDASPEMLIVAQETLNKTGKHWQTQIEDAFHLSFPDKKFDMVTTFRFIRHFEPSDRKKMYAEIRRVLKPGGILIFEALNTHMHTSLFIPENTGAADNSIYDELYTLETLKIELESAGFAIQKSIPNVNHANSSFFIEKYLGDNAITNVVNQGLECLSSPNCFQWEIVCQKKS